jgi:hypothetical protein
MISSKLDDKTFVGRALRLPRGAIKRQAMRLPYNNKHKSPLTKTKQ